MKVGTARYGTGKKVFKIKDGDNVYRIIPPIGNLADKGIWAKYYRVEWGNKNSKDETRPFQDVRVVNRETGMVEVESAAHLRRVKLETEKARLVELLKQGQATREQVKTAADELFRYNLDCKWHLNVINLNGEMGMLKIGHKAKLALDAEIDKLRQRGIDPISVNNGRFFNFFRNNPGTNYRDITTTVTVYSENVEAIINGAKQTVQQEKVHVLDDACIGRLETEAFKLDGLYPEITADQVQKIVDVGAPAVDEILGFSDRAKAETKTEATPETTTNVVTTPETTTNVVTTPETTTNVVTNPTPAAVTTPTVVPTPVAVTTPAPAAAAPAATPAATPAPAATTTAAPVVTTDMNDDEFLKSLGVDDSDLS